MNPISSSRKLSLSKILRQIAEDQARDRISFGALLRILKNRALAALLLIFAFPNILPTPPGTSAVLGAPLIFLAIQLALGRRPWLPAVIANRSMSRENFQIIVCRIEPWLGKAEKLLRPRVSVLAAPPMEYVIGFICFLLSLLLALPIPGGNMLPALAISLMALGLLERDGLWVFAGLSVAVVSGVIVSGVVFALVKTGIFLVRQVL